MGIFDQVLLAVDFDRTLTALDSTIPKRNLEAIRYFTENGGAFTVNTGRSIPMAEKNIFGKVGSNAPLLLYNGSAAYDEKTGELSQCMPIDLDPTFILPMLQERFPMLSVEVQAIDAHYLMHRDAGWEEYCRNNDCKWKYAAPEDIPGPFMKFSFYGAFHSNTVASMYQGTPEEVAQIDEALKYVAEHFGDKVEILRPCARIADIHGKGVSKLNAARRLQKELGKSLLVCVGDAENDIAMLQGADYAFCPSDGVVAHQFPNVCKCDDGAVADVIYEKIPGIVQKRS